MSQREETPIQNISATDLVVGAITIEPYTTEMVDMAHPVIARSLRECSHRWKHDELGGPSGDPVWTVGAVVDNEVSVDVQFTSRIKKKWKKQSGVRISFANNPDGTSPNTNASITGMTLGSLVKPGLYKTTADGKLAFTVSNDSEEEVYVVLYVGCSKRSVSPLIDFVDSVALPTFDSFTSPAPYTLRLEGAGFEAMASIDVGFTNGSVSVSGPLDPDQAATNADLTLVSWTDTVIEFTYDDMPIGTVIGVSLLKYTDGVGLVLVTSWLNQSLDLAHGFTPFAVLVSPPKQLDAVSFTNGQITATGTGFDNSVGLQIDLDDQFLPFLALDYSHYPSYFSRSETEVVTIELGTLLEQYGAQPGSFNVTRVWLRSVSTNADLGSVDDADITGDDTYEYGNGITVDI